MELPRPRPFGSEERTLDFLSLHGHSSFQHQQDPRAQRAYLETQDFLRPLEQVEKNSGKGENKIIKTATATTATTTVDKPLSSSSPSSSSVEHILPGGIGTYSISHISNFIQRVPKTEVQVPFTAAADRASSAERNFEVNKRADSIRNINYVGIGEGLFTLWDESAVVKKGSGATVKDTAGERQVLRAAAEKAGQWSSERTLQTPFAHRSSFSSLSTSKQSVPKNKSFMEMMKSSGRGLQDDDDDDDAGEEFTSKKPVSSHQEGKNAEQKANTPRSKHSATEQRRRSKINDRFQILRDLIPQNDQKRDKASFLLEVIEYVQFLQEKVHRYESSYQGWNQEPVKLTPWRNGHGPGESMVDHSRAINSSPAPALMFAGKFDDDSNIAAGPTMLANTHNSAEPDLSTSAAYKPLDHHTGLANKAVPMQSNSFTSIGRSDGHAHPLQRPDAENIASQNQSQLWQSGHCVTEFPVTGDVLNEQELTVEGGTISISGVYSQGLLNNLAQALQSLGVDLSQASISVQVDLGKRANRRLTSTTSGAKDHEDPSNNQTMMHHRTRNSGEESDQSHQKRRKID